MAEKKKKKKEKEYVPMAFPAPQERSLSEEISAITPMLGDLARTQSELDVAAKRQIAEDEWNFMVQHFGQATELTKSEAATSRELQELERQASRGFLRDTGPAMWQEAKAGQPELGRAIATMDRQMGEIGQKSEFTKVLDQQVMDELRLGGALTPEAERMAQQTARQAYAARGQVMGGSAAAAEVLSRDEMSRARLRERQGLGAQREAVGMQQQSVDRQFSMASAALLDQLNPAYKVLGLQTTTNIPALSTSSNLSTNYGGDVASVGSIMGSGLTYGSDLYSSNQNMSTDLFVNYQNALAQIDASKRSSSAQIQAAQIQAGATTSAAKTAASGQMTGSLIGAGGAIVGAGIIAVAF